MKKNLYYRHVFKRSNRIKEVILSLFLAVASYPRMVIEVFLRKNFGERYLSFATAVTIAVILAVMPFGLQSVARGFRGHINWPLFFANYSTWYAFIAAFIWFCLQRKREIKRNPSAFDFEKFSLYSGDINPGFLQFTSFGQPSVRKVETIYEPLVAFCLGLLLWFFFHQPIGYFLMICAVAYSLSYAGAYYEGDNFVMDKIDEMICNEEMFNAFVEDKDASGTRGVRFYGRKPVSDDIRRRVVESFTENTEETFIAQ